MTNNDIVNWGENWYEFKYYSYRDGCICVYVYKMSEDEYQEFSEAFSKSHELLQRNGIKTVSEYIKACLAFNA